jgi:hypothetical protein
MSEALKSADGVEPVEPTQQSGSADDEDMRYDCGRVGNRNRPGIGRLRGGAARLGDGR